VSGNVYLLPVRAAAVVETRPSGSVRHSGSASLASVRQLLCLPADLGAVRRTQKPDRSIDMISDAHPSIAVLKRRRVAAGTMELGLGIHGEPGARTAPLQEVNGIVEEVGLSLQSMPT